MTTKTSQGTVKIVNPDTNGQVKPVSASFNSDTAHSYNTWMNGYATKPAHDEVKTTCENCEEGHSWASILKDHICPCCNGDWQYCQNCAEGTKNDMQAHNEAIKDVPIYKNDPLQCNHKKETGTQTGILCNDCGRVREPKSDFEKRLVSRYNYKGNGYVNYQMR